MSDQQGWDAAVVLLADEFAALPVALHAELLATLAVIRAEKAAAHALAAPLVAEACQECGGACCCVGKYHVTVIDLLGYLAAAEPLFTPDFTAAHCPYLGGSGCLMPPGLRPFTCIVFNCERIEERLATADLERLRQHEQVLRQEYRRIEELCANRFMGGVLQNYRRCREQGATGLLRGGGRG